MSVKELERSHQTSRGQKQVQELARRVEDAMGIEEKVERLLGSDDRDRLGHGEELAEIFSVTAHAVTNLLVEAFDSSLIIKLRVFV